MDFFPFFRRPYYYYENPRYMRNPYYNNNTLNYHKEKETMNYTSPKKDKVQPEPEGRTNLQDTRKNKEDSTQVFEIFGIKLYFDDILIIALIFFLYNEGVRDNLLFISLILLLLS